MATASVAPLVPVADTALDLAPGVHLGVPESVYHRNVLGGASAHLLRQLGHAPAVYAHGVLHPEDAGDTPALALGRAFHVATLQPELWGERYAISPDFGDLRKKENKAARQAWLKANEGKEPIADEDAARVFAMAQAVRSHPIAGRLLASGHAEVTLRWNRGPVRCKARADWWVPEMRVALDLKSTEDARAEAFARAVAVYDYHRQEAFYRASFEAVGEPIEAFPFVVCEKSPPHLVAVYCLAAEAVALGRQENEVLLDQLASCVERGEWPGLPEMIQEIPLPRWRTR